MRLSQTSLSRLSKPRHETKDSKAMMPVAIVGGIADILPENCRTMLVIQITLKARA